MYPPSKNIAAAEYYPTAPPQQAPSMGVPAAAANQYYYSEGPPPPPPPLQVESRIAANTPWSTGLCDCCDDVGNCCITCFCPCITFGQIAEIIDRGSTSCGASGALYTLILCLTGCSCLYSCFYRSKLRRQYGLAEGSCPDCIVHCCCESCALCQEYRELKNRGFDPVIGWQATMERQGPAVTFPPPVGAGGMTR
ncbi:hypothetical protein Taro_042503 [Colocasia esculenta]|uniref:Uncharacterized protein n=1 Tax=Colocasia esculenta TaxID=4460 RepID=A0A843WH21_COLES|nr:hypothetical protein [Colocasia esculenta]